MAQAFADYPRRWGSSRPDSNIDHRRVANLMSYFRRCGAADTQFPRQLRCRFPLANASNKQDRLLRVKITALPKRGPTMGAFQSIRMKICFLPLRRLLIRIPAGNLRHQYPKRFCHPNLRRRNAAQMSAIRLRRIMLANSQPILPVVWVILRIIAIVIGHTVPIVITGLACWRVRQDVRHIKQDFLILNSILAHLVVEIVRNLRTDTTG